MVDLTFFPRSLLAAIVQVSQIDAEYYYASRYVVGNIPKEIDKEVELIVLALFASKWI